MKKFGPSLLISLLLHVGLILLAYISWIATPAPLTVASVPVTIVSDMPSRQMAEAPVDELAVKTPEPIPAPPEPVPPVPQPQTPVPAPVQPKPAPPQKPAPATPAKTPPDKNGMKKPQPDTKPTKKPAPAQAPQKKPDLLDSIAANTPSQSPTRRPASASTQRTTGISAQGLGPADAGLKNDLAALIQKLTRLWNLQCDVPGSRDVVVQVRFTLSPSGRITDGPDWLNRRNDPVWVAQANLAMAAVNKGQPTLYTDLPDGLYNRPITINFDARKACQGK